MARLSGKDAFGRENSIAIVKVPRVLPRVIRLPDRLAGGRQAFVLLTSVIRAHLAELFPGRAVEVFSQFRVTRDSDLEVDGDDVTNLRQALRTGLTDWLVDRATVIVDVAEDVENLRQVIAIDLANGTASDAENGRYNVLLLGGDSGAGRWGLRPDSMTIASIDVAADRLATMASLKALVLGEAMVPA